MLWTMNFRRNPGISIAGSNSRPQDILADLYRDGKFERSAVVASLSSPNEGEIRRYCNLKNWEYRHANCHSDLPESYTP